MRAAPATIGDTATTSARRAASASRTPGTRSTGSIESSGFDGATTTRSAAAIASITPGAGRGARRALDADAGDRDAVAAPHEVLLEGHRALGGVEDRRERVVGRRQEGRAHPEAPGDLGGDDGLGRALGEPVGAVQVGREVPVAEREPVRAAQVGQGVARDPGLAGPAPAGGRVDQAGQRVGHGVEVRADDQPAVREVVADVDHRDEVGLVDHRAQREEQSGGAHPAAEHRDHARDTRGASVASGSVSGDLLDGWPAGSCAVGLRLDAGAVEVLGEAGDLDERREWASVSKLAVALAFGVEEDWGLHRFTEGLGPRGATLANLLSHSAGLGLEEGDPTSPVGARRVYSNYGVDLAVAAVVGGASAADWLAQRVFTPLGMAATALEGRPASGVVGSARDLATLAVAWLRPDGVSRATRDRMVAPYIPGLAGVVPGFGRFDPCPWGLGPEVAGEKHHWMGDWPPESFGHFGQSGSLALMNAREGIGVVAVAGAPFGPWAVELWPRWSSGLLARLRA